MRWSLPDMPQHRADMVRCLLLVLLSLLAYSSVFSAAGFIWDDDFYVINNHHLRSVSGLYNIWFEPGATPQYYPMVFTLFWAQFHLWGLDPLGYHLVNILFHAANALLLWLCLGRLRVPGAFLAACIFVLHPVHVESVAWITELKNVLSTFFYLLAFLTYWRFYGAGAEDRDSTGRKAFFYVVSLLLFLLALFSKTVSGSLPAAILLLLWWRQGSFGWLDVARLLPFFALALILGKQTANLEVNHVLAKGPEWDFSVIDRVLIAGRAAWFYAGKLLWPHPLVFNYPRWPIDAGVWWQYLFPAALCVLLVVLWLLRRRIGRGPLVAVLFFLGTLFPALGFFNVYPMRFSFVADHFQYLASVGLIVLFCAAGSRLLSRLLPGARLAATMFSGAVLLLMALLTWQQGRVYLNNLTLFTDVLAKNPASWFAYANRAGYYLQAGQDALAMADLERSLQLRPDDADSLHMQALLYLKRKDFDRAFANFDRSIALRPWRADYFKSRCNASKLAGRNAEALLDAGMVLRAASHDPDNFLLRASIYLAQENYPAALGDLNRAIDIDPEKADSWANRGLVYLQQGLVPEAISDFNRAIILDPSIAAIYYNRGLAHVARGNSRQALEDLNHAKCGGYAVSDDEISRILAKSIKGVEKQ